MTRLACLTAIGLMFGAAAAHAQTVVYQPVTTYYAPVGPTTYTVASPVVAAPAARVTYYAPVAPAPVATTCCAPVVAPAPAPAATVTYYRAPQVTYQPTAQVVTRHRPILGGTVSRVQYGYTPVVY